MSLEFTSTLQCQPSHHDLYRFSDQRYHKLIIRRQYDTILGSLEGSILKQIQWIFNNLMNIFKTYNKNELFTNSHSFVFHCSPLARVRVNSLHTTIYLYTKRYWFNSYYTRYKTCILTINTLQKLYEEKGNNIRQLNSSKKI